MEGGGAKRKEQVSRSAQTQSRTYQLQIPTNLIQSEEKKKRRRGGDLPAAAASAAASSAPSPVSTLTAALLTLTADAAAAAASSSDLMASPAVVTVVRLRQAAEQAGPPKSAHNSQGRGYLPIGANRPRMRESATTEQSMSARRAAFPSRLGSPLAELRVFISVLSPCLQAAAAAAASSSSSSSH